MSVVRLMLFLSLSLSLSWSRQSYCYAAMYYPIDGVTLLNDDSFERYTAAPKGLSKHVPLFWFFLVHRHGR